MPYDPKLAGRVADVDSDELLEEARKRYQFCVAAHAKNRERYKTAMEFVAGNQWDERLKMVRLAQQRPCLVMDRLTTHINQVVNDQRQSKPAIKVHPVDDQADVKTAEIYNGLIRHIEHVSNAPNAYETAGFCQVAGGQGVWRIATEYVDEMAFEQDILIKREINPLVYWFDPEAKQMAAEDGRFAFVEQTYTLARFEDEYPDVAHEDWPAEDDPDGWWTEETVRCAEYFRVVIKDTVLFLMQDGSVMSQEDYAMARQSPQPPIVVDQRPAKRREVQWFKLGGAEIIDSRVWPGKWIPLVRVIGNEMCVDGEIIYTGLTHRAMDPQRMYNYQTSVVVEILSLQKTAPYIGAKGQFKGLEKQWKQANTANAAYLEYEPITIDGNLAPAPQRQSAPSVPTGNAQAMQMAAQDLQWITGQHSASFGAPSNETSGKAINARQQEGDTATYHYLDNISTGILHTGRILVDLIPKIYDTRRVLRILGEDDTAQLVTQDPSQQQPMTSQDTGNGVEKIYNLGVGRYDVAVSVGPSFGTKRQEAVEAMTQLLQGNPQLWQAIGDIYIRNQDWPGSKEMADRLAKTVPPELKSEEETNKDPAAQLSQMQGAMQQAEQAIMERDQMLQQAQQAMEQMQAELQKVQQDQAAKAAQATDKTESEKIRAETERYKVDGEIRIAEIQAAKEALQAQTEALSANVAALKELIAAGAQPTQTETMLSDIVDQQQAVLDASADLMEAVNQPAPAQPASPQQFPEGE